MKDLIERAKKILSHNVNLHRSYIVTVDSNGRFYINGKYSTPMEILQLIDCRVNPCDEALTVLSEIDWEDK